MKNFVWVALMAPLVLGMGSRRDNHAKQDVLDFCDAYLAAIGGNNGAAAVSMMDEKYVDDFQHILNAARSAKREQVYRMRPSERLRIASLRNRLTRDELRTVDARTAVSLIIDGGARDRGGPVDLDRRRDVQEAPGVRDAVRRGDRTQASGGVRPGEGVWKLDPECFDRAFDDVVVRWASR